MYYTITTTTATAILLCCSVCGPKYTVLYQNSLGRHWPRFATPFLINDILLHCEDIHDKVQELC